MCEGLSSGSSVSFFATDHLGSVTTTIWAGGNLRARLRYKPWGEQRWAQYTTPTGYRYTAQRWDSGLGLYDYNARYYDPHIGRFISADTLCWGAVFIWLLWHGLETSHSSQRKTAPEQEAVLQFSRCCFSE